jgi:hypothetical protein
MKRQRGMTLGGLMFLLLLMGFATYSAFRVLPAYIDYWTVRSILRGIATQPELDKVKERELRERFARELRLNNVSVVDANDLVIERVANGVLLSTEFSAKKPFIGAVNLCMDFTVRIDSTRP